MVKQGSSPEDEAAMMQRCSQEGRAVEMQRSGDADETEEMR